MPPRIWKTIYTSELISTIVDQKIIILILRQHNFGILLQFESILVHVILDTISIFLCELDMKPHLVKMKFFFPQNHVIVRPTKIIKELLKDCKSLIFKSMESFQFFSMKNIRLKLEISMNYCL